MRTAVGAQIGKFVGQILVDGMLQASKSKFEQLASMGAARELSAFCCA